MKETIIRIDLLHGKLSKIERHAYDDSFFKYADYLLRSTSLDICEIIEKYCGLFKEKASNYKPDQIVMLQLSELLAFYLTRKETIKPEKAFYIEVFNRLIKFTHSKDSFLLDEVVIDTLIPHIKAIANQTEFQVSQIVLSLMENEFNSCGYIHGQRKRSPLANRDKRDTQVPTKDNEVHRPNSKRKLQYYQEYSGIGEKL